MSAVYRLYENGARKKASRCKDIRTQCVYVIEGASNACKVGRSRNVGRRSRDLDVASPTGARVYYAICLRFQDACRLEKLVHKKLKSTGRHAHGEWFYISAEAASGLIEQVADRAGLAWVPDLTYGFGRDPVDTYGKFAKRRSVS
jgi:hypothetical protein